MKIDKKLLKDWIEIREASDVLAMIEANPGTYYTAYYRAFKGDAPLTIIAIMKKFYAEKRAKMKKIGL